MQRQVHLAHFVLHALQRRNRRTERGGRAFTCVACGCFQCGQTDTQIRGTHRAPEPGARGHARGQVAGNRGNEIKIRHEHTFKDHVVRRTRAQTERIHPGFLEPDTRCAGIHHHFPNVGCEVFAFEGGVNHPVIRGLPTRGPRLAPVQLPTALDLVRHRLKTPTARWASKFGFGRHGIHDLARHDLSAHALEQPFRPRIRLCRAAQYMRVHGRRERHRSVPHRQPRLRHHEFQQVCTHAAKAFRHGQARITTLAQFIKTLERHGVAAIKRIRSGRMFCCKLFRKLEKPCLTRGEGSLKKTHGVCPMNSSTRRMACCLLRCSNS